MTTKFNSFDASPLGAFVESPLGARNRLRPAMGHQNVLVILWLVRDPAYVEPGGTGEVGVIYEPDRVAWNSFLANRVRPSRGALRIMAIQFSALQAGWQLLVPEGFEVFEGLIGPFLESRRDPPPLMTSDRMLDIFVSFGGHEELTAIIPLVLVFLPDKLSVELMQPAISQFLQAVAAGLPDITITDIRTAEDRFLNAAMRFAAPFFPLA